MTRTLLRTLTLGYGIAALAAGALAGAGGGVGLAMLVVWIGGAAVTLALTAAFADRAGLPAVAGSDLASAELDRNLDRWREDEAQEKAAAARSQDAAAPRA